MGSIRSGEDQYIAVETEQVEPSAKVPHPPVSLNRLAPTRTAVPPWLWWNILSLDAPAVAIAWALLFARAGRVRVPAATIAVLALAVWLIYLADRVLDGVTAHKSALRERHYFYSRHRPAVYAGAVIGLILSLWLAYHALNAADVKAGMILAGLVGAYMLCVHLGGAAVSRIFPKEATVGVLFAAGTALPVWSQYESFSWSGFALWGVFAVICTLNCVAIESWETEAPGEDRRQPSAIKIRRAGSRIGVFAAFAAALSLPAFLSFPGDHTAIAASAGAALLILLLNLYRTRLSRDTLRVLADAALLAPAILALIFRR